MTIIEISIKNFQDEVEAMLNVLEAERKKLSQQKIVLQESRSRLIEKKKQLSEQKNMLALAAKSLCKAEATLEQKLDEMEEINKVYFKLQGKFQILNLMND